MNLEDVVKRCANSADTKEKDSSTGKGYQNAKQCLICKQEFFILKFLICEHAVCEYCIEVISTVETNRKIVKCPFDQTVTEIPNGKIASLKSSLLPVELTCEGCNTKLLISKLWWCVQCQLTLCSDCAMRKHRNHLCNPWEDYDVVADCLNFYKKIYPRNPDECQILKREIVTFCSSLQNILMQRVDEEEIAWNAVQVLERTFGSLNATQKKKQRTVTTDNIKKKLKTVTQLLGAVQNETVLPTEFCDSFCHPVTVPSLEQALSLCFGGSNKKADLTTVSSNMSKNYQQSNQQPHLTIESPKMSNNLPSNKQPDVNTELPNTSKNHPSTAVLASPCLNPVAMCLISSNELVLLNKEGVHVFHLLHNKVERMKGWSTPIGKGIINKNYPLQIVYRASDSFLFICRVESKQSAGRLHTYSKQKMEYKSSIALSGARQEEDLTPRLICIFRDQLLVAFSDGKNHTIWLLCDDKSWTKIWDECNKLEPFRFCEKVVQPSQNFILISGVTVVYKISFTDQLCFQDCETICNYSGPLININQSVWVFLSDCTLIVRLTKNGTVAPELPLCIPFISSLSEIVSSLHDCLCVVSSDGSMLFVTKI